jgi:extracellular factor (EF) 3-hydroxypalmitic acid methyl ester biosynthesis protein
MSVIPPNGTDGGLQDCHILCKTAEGVNIHATVLKLSRFSVVFEIYGPESVLRLSESLAEFRIVVRKQIVYSGRATVQNLVNTEQMQVCEATLAEGSWQQLAAIVSLTENGSLRREFDAFIQSWQKLYRIRPEYKIIIADMQSFFLDLRGWLEQVEFGLRSSANGDHAQRERDVAVELAKSVIPLMNALFQKFEGVAQGLEVEDVPAHRDYMRRQLHPLLLCAPFAHRTFEKPLGYAGDYEMVNMILRNVPEGASLFAKIVNTWFLDQPPARAHRNRINYLKDRLVEETARSARKGRPARILNLGCGPAVEVQEFLRETPLSDRAQFTLLDFNDETIQHTRSALGGIQREFHRGTSAQVQKKSVLQVIKDSLRTPATPPARQNEFIYCAGLFDYLPDHTCLQLTEILYEMLAPGGLLVTTNVEPSNPLRNGMEHLLDWNLKYRTGAQMRTLRPRTMPADDVSVLSDTTGVNVMLEVRKPENV